MVNGAFDEEKIDSRFLHEKMEIIIYLPENYSSLYKYPIFIIQDGKDYIHFGKLPRVYDELLKQKKIQKAIFAFLPYKNLEDRRQKYHPEGSQNEDYIRFLVHELLPHLERKFPTFEMAGGRFLMGTSLGASVSLKIALKYPFTFSHAILYSPFLNEDLLHLTKKTNPALLKVFHIIGKQEVAVQTTDNQVADFLTPNLAFHKQLKEKGFDYQFHLFNGGHFWKNWQPYLKDTFIDMISSPIRENQ